MSYIERCWLIANVYDWVFSADVIAFFVINYFLIKQTEDQCCNNCEEVQEAYKKKGWALPNQDLIDQVLFNYEFFILVKSVVISVCFFD